MSDGRDMRATVIDVVRSADADQPGRRTRERRRQSDIDFLAWVRTASLEELRARRTRLLHIGGPKWRYVAVERAIDRLSRKGGAR